MTGAALPPPARMVRAVLEKDPSFDGVFLQAVRTTGIFCRPSCPSRRPDPGNLSFFADAAAAARAGFRPCRRCRPAEEAGAAPAWIRPLLAALEEEPGARLADADLRARGLDPVRVRRWFLRRHGTTFQAFARARRVGRGLERLRGGGGVLDASLDAGYASVAAFHEAFRRLAGSTPARGREAVPLHLARFAGPLGPMVAAATGEGLCLLEFADRPGLDGQVRRLAALLRGVPVPGGSPLLREAEREVRAFLAGRLREFTVPLLLPGTEFERAAWEALRAIPYGETRSYAEQAAAVGRPSAVRAVAGANGRNRVAILVPCHRVVGADGRLAGYGGGVWRKRRLLEIERGAAGRART